MADLTFNVVALDRASQAFIRMSEQVERMSRRLDTLEKRDVQVRVGVDEPVLQRAVTGVAALGRGLASLAAPTALAAAVPMIASLGGAAVTAAGSLWLLPAVGVAAGVAFGTAKVGLQGFGDAMANRADPEAFAASVAKLSPAARAAAVGIRDLTGAWTTVRLDVQERLFAGVNTQVQTLAATYLPILKTTLGGVAGGFNTAAVQVGSFLSSGPGISAISVGMDNVRSAVSTAAQAAAPLVRAFTDIFVVGSGYLPGFATSIADAATRFSEFIATARETGELAGWITDGIGALGQLGSVAGSVGGILKTVFDAAAASGTDTLGVTERLTFELEAFLSAGAGNTALVTLFSTINQTIDALLPGLVAVATSLATGIVALGPALPPLAAAVTEVAISVAPLLGDLATLAAVVLPPLTAGLHVVAPLLGPIAAGMLAMLVVTKVAAGYAFLTATLTGYAIAQGTSSAAMLAGVGIFGAARAALQGYIIAQGVAVAASAVGTGVIAGFALAFQALRVAIMANPIMFLVTVLIGIAAALVYAYNHFEGFRVVVDTVFAAVGAAGIWLWENALRPAFDGIMTGLRWVGETATWLWDNAIRPAWDGIVAGIGAAWTFLAPIFAGIGAAVEFMGKLIFAIVVGTIIVAWELLSAAARFLWENVLRPTFDFIATAWSAMGRANEQIYLSVIRPTFDGVATVARFLWENVLRPTFDFIATAWSAMGRANEAIYLGVIRPVLDAFGVVGNALWNNVLKPVFDFIATGWASMAKANDAIYRTVIEPVFRFFGDTARTFSGVFTSIVDGVKSTWASIQDAFKAPVRFVIETVWNNGIGGLWDKASALFPLGAFPRVPVPFAGGGPIERPTLALMGEAGPEYVLSTPAVVGLGGMAAVDRMHRQAIRREPPVSLAGLNSGRLVEGADHEGPGISATGFGGVRPHVARAGHYLKARFGIGTVGGVGARANPSDHPSGHALDFMTYSDRAKGDALASYLVPNAGHFAVKYLIWKQAINQGSGWRPMEDRGSVTANHFDHVHVSFLSGPGGEGAFSGAGGGFLNPFPEIIQGFFDVLVNPLIAAMPGGPPMILDIPKGIAGLARDKALAFLLEKAGAASGFANGGIVDRPTFGLLGEAGPEAVLPLTRPVRAAEVLAQAGLLGDTGMGSKLDELIGAQRELAALLRDARPIVVEDRSGNPTETARATALALRT